MAEKIDAKPAGSNVTPELFQEHFWKIVGYRRALDEANGEYRAAVKAAKTAGLNTKMLIKVMNDRRGDPEQLAVDARDYARMAKWIDLPIGLQGSLFGDDIGMPSAESMARHSVEDAFDQGIAASRAGAMQGVNPHTNGTETFAAWNDGWLHAQAKIAAEMAISGEAAKAAKKAAPGRKGRPKRGAAADQPAA